MKAAEARKHKAAPAAVPPPIAEEEPKQATKRASLTGPPKGGVPKAPATTPKKAAPAAPAAKGKKK